MLWLPLGTHGRALARRSRDYTDTLFCDRAVIGGWDRTTETLRPYTIAETMDAGWAWQIEHEHFITAVTFTLRDFLSDDDALAEFLERTRRSRPHHES
jgi:tryptophan halogenase